MRMPIKSESKAKKRNVNIHKVGDVKRLLNSIINDLRNKEIDSKSANAIGYLANIMLKTIELEELEEKIVSLEKGLEKL
ncbi:hypothetical protein D3C72_2224800 [compost metagenome]